MERKHIELKPFTWMYVPLSLISRCDMDIYAFEDDRAVVVVADREDNRDMGMGMKEGVMTIAGTVMDKYGFSPENLTWIEYQPEAPETGTEAAYEQVSFETAPDGQLVPKRSPIDKEAVDALIQGK